jgi:acyl-CoA thioester hydrolase
MSKLIYEQTVYPYQIDYVGHLNNVIYIEWMEVGRTKLLEAIGLPLRELEKRGIAPILVETTIKYKKAIYVSEVVKIEIWISELKNASAVMSFNFYNEKGELSAFGSQRGLFIHRESVKPYRLSLEERKAFQKLYVEK